MIFVGKKDGTQRMCVDYRVLNEVTEASPHLGRLKSDALSVPGG
jgi:hypothetical protein